MFFRKLLGKVFLHGTLEVRYGDGCREIYGDGQAPRVAIALTDRKTERWMSLNPSLRVAEAYMDSRLLVEEGSIREFMELVGRNFANLERQPWVKATARVLRQSRRLKQFNPMGRARKNVAHHYDLSGRLYDLFLDEDRQYSCAYYPRPETSLEEAQVAKKRHIAAKLLLNRPDLTVLDIGSGWGGLGLYLAQTSQCRVTGVTLSEEQHKVSRERAEAAGLGRCVDFKLEDYRVQTERFDRIVSVGMFEHVGKKNYSEFFARTYDLLDDDGVFLLHSIGRFGEPAPINPFMRKYIFPGADVPSLSEVMAAVERVGWQVTDIEILRLHYALTLEDWYERFQKNRAAVADLYDERFCRMWEMYLAGCEMGFRHQDLMVFQMQLAKKHAAVPITRDYMVDSERGDWRILNEAARRQKRTG
ncbi:MAG: class I SAM-dependent methyltransferase [Rhodospirillaceae bacterium]|nr:class I SAM-dependent methyltransferase [Rhodospirillaceae bacterium]